jgi:hypothetical protein
MRHQQWAPLKEHGLTRTCPGIMDRTEVKPFIVQAAHKKNTLKSPQNVEKTLHKG